MSKLQQALSKVQPPKVNPRVALQGAQYQGVTQQAANVRQEDIGGSLQKIIMGTGQLAESYDNRKVAEANKMYDHATAKGLDPMAVAAEAAKNESTGIVDWALDTTIQGGDRDPLFYQRSINASKKIEQANFQIDLKLQQDFANGTIRSEKEWIERRNTERKTALGEISGETGVTPTNRFISEAAAKNNEASMFALKKQWATTEEQAIVQDNLRTFNSGLSNLQQQGVTDAQSYFAYIDKSKAEGILRNDREVWNALNGTIGHAVETGNMALVNGLMGYQMEVNGEMVTVGDAMSESDRGEIFAKAEASLINNNEKLFDEYQDRLTNISLLSQAGDGAGAKAQIKATLAWLDRYQPSDRVTTQRRELAQLERQVSSNQLAQSMAIRKENAKKAESLEQEGAAMEIMTAYSQGQTVNWDAVPTAAYDRVVTKRLQAINTAGLNPQDAAVAYGQIISMSPPTSNARKTLGTQYAGGLEQVKMAMVVQQNGQGSQEIPPQVNSTLQLFKANPAVAQAVMTPQQYQEMAIMSEQVDKLGWAGMNSVAANMKFDFEQEQEFARSAATMASELGLNPAQTEAFMMDARVTAKTSQKGGWFSGDGPNVKGGLKATRDKWQDRQTELSTGVFIERDKLAAFSNPKTIPVVESALKQKIETIKAEGKDLGFTYYHLQERENGKMAVINTQLGIVMYEGSPDDIYREQMQVTQDKKQDTLDELRGAVNESSMKNTERQQEVNSILDSRIYN